VKKSTANQLEEHYVERYIQLVTTHSTSFVQLLLPSKYAKFLQNLPKIRTYSNVRSSKVIDLGANRKRRCNFLLVTIVTLDVSRYNMGN